jgi:tetratricopeptide (TPR) repeat protein
MHTLSRSRSRSRKAGIAQVGDTPRSPGRSSSDPWRSALDHDLGHEAGNCFFSLSDQCFQRDEYTDALGYLDEALALARKLGNRPEEWAVLAERTYPLYMLGRWDEAQATSAEFTQEQIDAGGTVLSLLQSGVEIHLQRGELDGAHRVFSMFSRLEESTDVQERSMFLITPACLHRAQGRPW